MSQKPTPSPLGYRPEQVSQITGLGRTKILELIGNGTLESTKIGRSRIVLASSVRALIEGQDAA